MGHRQITAVFGLPQELCAKRGQMKQDENLINDAIEALINSIESMNFALAIVDEDLRIKYINSKMSDFLDFSSKSSQEDEFFFQLVSDDETSLFSDFLESSQSDGKANPWKLFNLKSSKGKANQLLLNKISGNEILLSSRYEAVIGIPIEDIHIETALNQNDKRDNNEVLSNKYHSIFNNAIIGIIVFDSDFYIEEVNQTFADQFNIIGQDVIGEKIEKIFSGPVNEAVQKMIREINQEKNQVLKEVITVGKETNEHTILELTLSKFQNPYDHMEKNMMIIEDITKVKDTHEALIQSEKLALTGRLAASLAHEINNPLQASIGCLGLADEILEEEERKSDLGIYINMAMDELKRGARIVKKLRDLNRKSEKSEKTIINLKKKIDNVLVLVKNRLSDRNIVPVFLYESEPPQIVAVRDQIQSVVLNIVMNAIDAMPNGGYIYIDIEKTTDPEGFKLKIRDTGIGMDKSVSDHLFDPFFTTKNEGIGLGLYLCNQIIEDHKGYIQVESKTGKGTIFTIWLPKGELP